MLIANKTVAEHFFKLNSPIVYRIHDKPDIDKTAKLLYFLSKFGLHVPKQSEELSSKEIQNILQVTIGKDYESLINAAVLHSMSKATYSSLAKEHFGLAFEHYCHFTSPIRRYADLSVHRAIKNYLDNKTSPKKIVNRDKIIAQNCSDTEIFADELEGQLKKNKMSEFLENKIGNEYCGIISGVTQEGIYVQLPNTIKGLVKIRSLKDDYYEYDEDNFRLIGRNTRNIFTFGQQLIVKVIKVNQNLSQIDFELIQRQNFELIQRQNNC